jgi:hypothetical protein
MALKVRKGSGAVQAALVSEFNKLRAQAAVSATKFHSDVTSKATTGDHSAPAAVAQLIDAPDATDLATSLVLVNQIKKYYNAHAADAVAHKAADAANAVSAVDATNLATAQTLANEIKTDYTAHIASTTYHHSADATNTIAAANASDQGTLNTLLNEIKADFNAHIQSAPTGHSVVLVDP